jgi:hypothetical protein
VGYRDATVIVHFGRGQKKVSRHSGNLVSDAEVVEIREAARSLGRVVEQRETRNLLLSPFVLTVLLSELPV